MNAKSAKLISRFSAAKQFSSRSVKRTWKRMPRNKRAEMRKMMESETV